MSDSRVIDHEGVQRLLKRGAQLVDVLPLEEYQESHLPGAMNLPLAEISKEAGARLERGRPVAVYCADSQ